MPLLLVFLFDIHSYAVRTTFFMQYSLIFESMNLFSFDSYM